MRTEFVFDDVADDAADSNAAAAVSIARIGSGLPAASLVPELREVLGSRGSAVVSAPPGSGKTTIVPPLVAAAFSDEPGHVVVTQPRRIAARAAAHRLADLTGTKVGELAGFTVRGERRVSAGASIEFCTPGVLLRRLLADPGLEGTSAVICDEVHERQLDTDLVLGMLVELRELRPELGLLAMSATVDAPRFAALLGGSDPVPVLDSPAVPHELEIRYAPPPGPRQDGRGVTDEYCRHVATQAARSLAEHPGDALVFLPGAREIERVAGHLEPLLSTGVSAGGPARGSTGTVGSASTAVEILRLHGSLPAREQDAALRPAADGRRRVVLSTAVAESSLTVPGVRIVIDSCLSREPRLDSARGVSGLVTVSSSQDSANQRAGRAARIADGVAVRCIAESDWPRLRPHRSPEIQSADLTSAALDLACWGTPRGEGLPLLDSPPAASIERAETSLATLSAIDDGGRATSLGRLLARVPADPRIARGLLAGTAALSPAGSTTSSVAGVAAALLDPPRRGDASLPAAIAELRSGRHPQSARWRREAERLERLAESLGTEFAELSDGGATGDEGPGAGPFAAVPRASENVAGLVTALCFADRIARRVSAPGESGRSAVFKLASGSQVLVPPGSGVAESDWIAVAEASRVGERIVARLASPLTEAEAHWAGAPLLAEELSASFDGSHLRARSVRSLGAIELSSTPARPSPEAGRAAVLEWIRGRSERGSDTAGADWFDEIAGPDSTAGLLRRRLACARAAFGDPWPAMDTHSLAVAVEEGLSPIVTALAEGTDPGRVDAAGPLRGLVSWPEAGRIDELVPERIELPSGNSHRVRYPSADLPSPVGEDADALGDADAGDPADSRTDAAAAPVVSAKLQEFFGLAASPTIADGRVAVTVELLSPAGRPLAVSRDLSFFWDNAYPAVRAEMRGRYAKHPWPEEPWNAPATARTKRALGGEAKRGRK